MKIIKKNPDAVGHVFQLYSCEMSWNFCFIGIPQINFHDSACALVDKPIVGTELAREADSHTFVQRKYSVQMSRIVDVRGSEELMHKIALCF